MVQDWWNGSGAGLVGVNGIPGVTFTQQGQATEPIPNSFEGDIQSLFYSSGPVAALEAKRVEVFCQAPMLFQRRKDGRPGELFDDESLELLRSPWPGGTTSDLMARALLYADL